MSDVTVRQARLDDHDAVAAFTRDTWADRQIDDWHPETFPEWVRTDGDDQRTFVAEVDGEVAGVCQGVMLSDYEGWGKGLRVRQDERGRGVSLRMTERVLSWCRERGAAVVRAMVFSWNVQGLGASRAAGYRPCVEFRTARPDPDADASPGDATDLRVVADPDAAWSYWTRSEARDRLCGLSLDSGESWAVSECTRDRLRRAADESTVFAVQGPSGTRGAAVRSREYEREDEDGPERWVEYGLAAWADVPAARTLFAAIARDAAACGADRTRVLVPESPRHVSDTAYAGVEVGDDPLFVMAADVTGR